MSFLYVIAECAQGYAASSLDESLNLAIWLTKSAKAAGANAVKFQLVIAQELATRDYKHFKLFESLELGFADWKQVADLANRLDLDLIFDIFGEVSLKMAEDLGAAAIKLHPTDFTNIHLIRKVGASSIPSVIAGCGGCTFSEIQETIKELQNVQSLTLLHGFQGYPTSRVDNCLSRLRVLNSAFCTQSNLRLGFADHAEPFSTDSTHLAAASLGFGVTVIEKHLTLARCLHLEDYESALSPDEFHSFVDTIHACYEAIESESTSSNSFVLPKSEESYRKNVSRHVVSSSDLDCGHTIAANDLSLKRTSSSNALTDPLLVIGKKTRAFVTANTAFTLDIIEP